MLVAARAATTPTSGFRPRAGAALRLTARWTSWRAACDDFALEDDDDFDLFGHDVSYRRFAHRLGAVDVLCDQWSWPDGHGVTLTCSVARQDYWDYCDVFEAIAETVDLGPRSR